MEKKEKKHIRATKLLLKRTKLKFAQLHCCIPEFIENTGYIDGAEEYRARKKKFYASNKRKHRKRGKPWYMMDGNPPTYTIPKFSREQYIIGFAKAGIAEWEKQNPKPEKTLNGTKNAFYRQEYTKWAEERLKVYEDRMARIKNKPDRFAYNYIKQVRPDLHIRSKEIESKYQAAA